MELQKNHALQGGKYRIIEKIGQGGFAITYKANWSTEITGPMGKIATDVTVAVKEFFFADYCTRDNDTSHITISSPNGGQIFGKFKEKLKKEAAILSRLRHPNIVSVLDIFEENNTVYMVMEYISGGSLKDVIRKNGKLDETTTLRYASQLCDAVAEIHRNNVLHLDIKPGNILIDPNDNVRLIDFGISKQYNSDTHTETSTTPVGISKGFAPTEQYTGVAQFSPATDIYAIGATIYNMCSGKIPPEAVSLLDEDLPKINGISDQLWNAITKAMSVRRNQRPQSTAELMNLLPSANAAKNAPAQLPAQQPTGAYEKTQIVDQEPASEPTPQSAQQPVPVATYEKTKIVDQEPKPEPIPQPISRTKPTLHETQNQSASTTGSFNTTGINKSITLENKSQYYKTINDNNDKPNKKRNIILILGVIVAIIVFVLFFVTSNDSNSISETKDSTLTALDTSDTINAEISTNIDTPTIQQAETLEKIDDKKDEEIINDKTIKEKVTETEIIDDKNTTKKTPKKGTDEATIGTNIQTNNKEESQQIVEQQTKPETEPESNSNKIFTAVEQKPQFPGGEAALLRWLSTHIQYPLIAQEEGAQGRVIVQFVVEKDGRVGQTKIAHGRHPALDQEALRLVKSLPRFTPGYMNGTPVRCWFTLPVTFKLQ